MEKIQSIPKEVYDWFESTTPMYLVVGIRKQQMAPGQQPQFRTTSFHVGSLDELMTGIIQEELHRFRVYQVGATFSHEGQLKNDARRVNDERIEKQERELYEKLDKKYGQNKMEVVK